MSMSRTLFSRLSELAEKNLVPMHMPGHKRNVNGIDFLEALGGKFDITEIQGFDGLHDAHSILKESMERAARLWKSGSCFFLVNGSTCGILAAVRAASRASGTGKIIMARNSHKAVYNAVELCLLDPIFITPQTVPGFGFCGSIQAKSIELSVADNPGTPVIVTSPTYEGIISNISEIAIICHMHGSPLIVDGAHGAHLDLSPDFPGGAVRAGADLVIQSVHKTLTGLTQTALLHLNGGLITPESVRAELAVFQSTSPSYLLMASIDGTVDLIESRGTELFGAWKKRLDRFDRGVESLGTLRIPGHSEFFECQSGRNGAGYRRHGIGSEEVFGFDRSKLVISCEGTDTTGVELLRVLYERYGVECDMAAGGYCIALTGLTDTNEGIDRLAEAVCEIDSQARKTAPRIPMRPIGVPPRRMSVYKALSEQNRDVPLREAKGRVSAEYVYAYPPGIPLVVPGEELTEDIVSGLSVRREVGVALKSTTGGMPRTVRVVL